MPRLFVEKSIEINASASRVWDALTKLENTDKWAFEFSSGGPKFHIESNWELGSPVLWKGQDCKVCVEGNVTALEPNKLLRFTVFDARDEKKHLTEEDGITFKLTKQNDKTILQISQGDYSIMAEGEKYQRITAETWDRVLPRIKALAEK